MQNGIINFILSLKMKEEMDFQQTRLKNIISLQIVFLRFTEKNYFLLAAHKCCFLFNTYLSHVIIIIIIKRAISARLGRVMYTLSVKIPQSQNTNILTE